MSGWVVSWLAVLVIVGPVPAQAPSTTAGVATDALVTVTRAAKGEVLHSVRAHQRGCVIDAGGRIWVVVRRTRVAGFGMSRIELHASTDGGRTFTLAGHTPGVGLGSIACGPNPTQLLVTWSRAGRPGTDAVYRAFDTERMEWVGKGAMVLAAAGGGDDQYRGEGVVVTQGGTVFVAISSQRSTPRRGGWRGSWSMGIRERIEVAADRDHVAEFGPLRQVNVGSFGVAPDLAAHGSLLHSSYRSQGNAGHGIWTRRFDLERDQFADQRDVAASAITKGGRGRLVAGNPSALTTDLDGARYVAFYSGGQRAGSGRIELAHATATGTAFTRSVVAEDPALVGGNTNEQCVSLSNGPGDHVEVVFAKRSEQHRCLWRRVYSAGKPLGPARIVAESRSDGAFERVSGVRGSGAATSSVRAVVSGPTKDCLDGRVALYGLTWPARVR